MIMNERAFALGLAFRQGLLSACKKFAEDEKRWITIHPNGKFDMNGDPIKGQPILIDDDRGEVIGGAGGALNGKKLKKKKAAKKPATKQTKQKKPNAKKPKQQTPKQAPKEKKKISKNVPFIDRIASDKRTLKEARKSIQDRGISIGNGLSSMDKELQRVNLIALDHLMQEYDGCVGGAIKKWSADFSFTAKKNRSRGLAGISRSENTFPPVSLWIHLNKQFHSDYDTLIRRIKNAQEDKCDRLGLPIEGKEVGWLMPTDDKAIPYYVATHEFGHILSYAIALNRTKQGDLKNGFRSNYDSLLTDCKKNVMSNVIKAHKKKTGQDISFDEAMNKYMSTYGCSQDSEFFAEAFASAMSGKPNIVGLEMQKFLKGNA